MSVVVEVGPALVRARHGERCLVADPELTAAVLACPDDPFVLIGDRAWPTADVWSDIWESVLADADCVTLVTSSTWPRIRIDDLAETLRHRVKDLDVRSRSAAISAAAGTSTPTVVVEIAPTLVAVVALGETGATAMVSRVGAPDDVARRVAAEVARRPRPISVVLDVAAGVAGAHELARLIARYLSAASEPVRLTTIDGDRLLAEPPRQTSPRPPRPPKPRRSWLGGAAAAVVGSAAVLVVQIGAAPAETVSRQPVTVVVEGGVTVNVPALWPVDRVTEGTGSARLQLNSPDGDGSALHVTQSAVPDGETLERTAETLRRAISAEAPGVFVDFNPTDSRAGRRVVTYREVRADHDILWHVLVDGAVRISIGCQAVHGLEGEITTACEEAVRSAHATVETGEK